MAEDYRFVVDVNVGRLARWLRAMGYDASFPRNADDNGLVRIALQEDRVLVTRDSGFSRRRAARQGLLRVVQVADDRLEGQLRQLVRDLKLDLEGRFSRCVCCNVPLREAAKAQVEGRAPPYVYANHHDFRECPHCLRVYWRGSHWAAMAAKLDQVLGQALH